MDYFKNLSEILYSIKVTAGEARPVSFDNAIFKITGLLNSLRKKKNKVILVGNGGSASIASHIATDFLKNASVPAVTFSDSSLLTCLSNDLGYDYVFQRPIAITAQKRDVLFAISSSGRSKNILNAVKEARKRGCFLITLSGFNSKNPLRKTGDINFYLNSDSYGFVEIAHLAVCHCIVDKLIKNRKGNGQI